MTLDDKLPNLEPHKIHPAMYIGEAIAAGAFITGYLIYTNLF